jgi:polyphosphate kinase
MPDAHELAQIASEPQAARAREPVRPPAMPVDVPEAFFNRELSWLAFARRVVALVEQPTLPLLERLKFAGISGMLHDEFFMKRMSGLKRQIGRRTAKRSIDGRTPQEEFDACRRELLDQADVLARVLESELRPALARVGLGIHDYATLDAAQQAGLRDYFTRSVMPILTPLTVDSEHPFPFISGLGLNLAIVLPEPEGRWRFVRLKVPNNRPRWVPLPHGGGFTPLEQVIANNLDLFYPKTEQASVCMFRVTRGAEGEPEQNRADEDDLQLPGSIVEQVSRELKARRFAGVVRLQVDSAMPDGLVRWLSQQLGANEGDVYRTGSFLGLSDLADVQVAGRDDLRLPPHQPVTHPRLRALPADDREAIFGEIASGDLLLHHPYDSFDTSVLRFIESAAADPAVLAIKLTIYRTSSDSPIVRALAEAARRGKQVAVIVEITARFDEAPNIAWGKFLENEGAHVVYGVERLKTHVKLAFVVREEQGELRRYAHLGTGNYHTGTAKLYEDLGILTADPEVCDAVAAVFDELTGTTMHHAHQRLLVAPDDMRERFTVLVRREVEHAAAGRPAGIFAKMNQLQDAEMIRELYRASQAGVPVTLYVRGLCSLRPGVPGLSETIRVSSVVGRFLEHSRIYRFINGGAREYYIGSADWMHRNLTNRVETVVSITDPVLQRELDAILEIYERDNCSAWDCRPDGVYVQREPAAGEARRTAQTMFIERARKRGSGGGKGPTGKASENRSREK